ncbi:ThuA domain-containing protein [Rubripirellula obstinata]|nr:ThuA domain-containing protein [Rubripirellula obstinata]
MAVGIADAAQPRNVLMIAGARSHGYGAHEHYAGLKILEEAMADEDTHVDVVRGWPKKDSLIAEADTIVIYCDGGKRHLAIAEMDRLEQKLAEGCGLVCLHYAVETVPGEMGERFRKLLGGHFEVNYSVNPHWIAEFTALPDHSITRGVKPFQANDEWYFNMRFASDGKVTPILSAIAPAETMRRSDGPHSGNPDVRKKVAAGDLQTVAWAYERPDSGRSFGFTGGHYHWNWANQDILRLVTNAIRWTAVQSIPDDGSKLETAIEFSGLLENQDFDPPPNFNPDAIKTELGIGS